MIDPTAAVPFAGPVTMRGAPASPISFAWTSTSTVCPELVTAASSTATGKTVTVTVPVAQAGGSASSQASISKVSVPVNVPVGVYVNEPSMPTLAVPLAAGDETDSVRVCPVSGSLAITIPETAVVASVETATSPIVGVVLLTVIVPAT